MNGRIVYKPNPIAGFWDTCGVTRNGRFWAAEIKRPGEKLSELQENWREAFEKYKVLTKVITCYPDMIAFLKIIQDN